MLSGCCPFFTLSGGGIAGKRNWLTYLLVFAAGAVAGIYLMRLLSSADALEAGVGDAVRSSLAAPLISTSANNSVPLKVELPPPSAASPMVEVAAAPKRVSGVPGSDEAAPEGAVEDPDPNDADTNDDGGDDDTDEIQGQE